MIEQEETRCFDLPVGVAIKCVEHGEDSDGWCFGCDFNINNEMFANPCSAPEGLICGTDRKDKKDVIFKLVKYQKETIGVDTIQEISWRIKE
jgi:hypothetical protein